MDTLKRVISRRKIAAHRVRQARLKCGLTQADAAFRIGVHRNTVASAERNVAMSLDVAILLCELYGITPNHLFGYDKST